MGFFGKNGGFSRYPFVPSLFSPVVEAGKFRVGTCCVCTSGAFQQEISGTKRRCPKFSDQSCECCRLHLFLQLRAPETSDTQRARIRVVALGRRGPARERARVHDCGDISELRVGPVFGLRE